MKDDLISRQAAIDELGDEPEVWTGKDEYAQGLNNQWHYDRNAILRCPVAHPEIIRCKDCKWCEDADGLMCKNTASWVVATDYDFGCVCAERRQDATH